MKLADVKLDDKYTLERGRIFTTGIQVLVRLPMMQRRRDLAAGHNTAGFISGYRGSPLGGFDLQLRGAQRHLDEHHVVFKPGVNEDLAATAVWGAQQVQLNGESKYDGVFSIWYGKGPGVDRSGDAMRHGNLAGSSPLGGVLVLLGDDHTCESSTTAHQSEYAMVDAMIPILNPAGVQEIMDYGLYGWAMSRYSGCWVALKCMHDTVEAAASIEVDPARVQPALPNDFDMPQAGLSIRWPDTPQTQEARLHEYKTQAAQAFCRANGLDRIVFDSPQARLGIVTTGKSYLDVRQALHDLGVDESQASRLGLRLYKVAMTWPLEPQGVAAFCTGLDKIVVVEEKRGLIETQLKELMYARAQAPQVIGKRDEDGALLFRSAGRLESGHIAAVIGERLLEHHADSALTARVEEIRKLSPDVGAKPPSITRLPYFCAGCPHNSSTKIPEGSRALAGIGCHYMVQWMDRDTARFTQMGAEGASWIGEEPFSTREHVFQNIGDGTYFHSGLLAIRAAVGADSNITFKILYNDAVAMTGGQGVDGPLSVPQIARQVQAEGVARVAVVTDEPDKYRAGAFASDVRVYHRDDLDTVQRELRELKGTTVLVYDQTCAAEKRRRRKRGEYPDPAKRVFINEAVCEGCGDCGIKSNCVAVLPRETEFGRKREIDQSACNKDFSCLNGFCPSFVTVHGGSLRKGADNARQPAVVDMVLAEPELPALATPYGIVVTGVGGTGVITIGALVGMAAHLEDKGCSILDMTGLAQKGGAVMSHIIVAAQPRNITTTRIAAGGAQLLLGCDLVVTAGKEVLKSVRQGVTRVVANSHEVMTGDFTRDADMEFPSLGLRRAIESAAGADNCDFLPATRLATALIGDSIATNLFMLGYAWQRGQVPVSAAALAQAIELNGVAVEANKQAFLWGRRAAVDQTNVAGSIAPDRPSRSSESLDDLVERRARFLTEYQDTAYARRYLELVAEVREVENEKVKGRTELSKAVASYYFKLLAYKDEYEVARLYTNGDFVRQLEARFEGDFSLEFHLAPPLLARRDPATGELGKRRFGPWMLGAFRWLARFRALRGTKLDVFGYTAERKRERRLVADYERIVEELLAGLDTENHPLAVELAELPAHIRGFGHVKTRSLCDVERKQADLLAAYRTGEPSRDAA
ncbi:MAG: indolepyruvate ferredoxin oxidoreductase family protein [Gammaproteobacteria bacterium]